MESLFYFIELIPELRVANPGAGKSDCLNCSIREVCNFRIQRTKGSQSSTETVTDN